MNQWIRGSVARAAALVTAAVATVGGPPETTRQPEVRPPVDPARDLEAMEQARLRRLGRQQKRAARHRSGV
jgi:hypothetical protein